LAGDNEQNGLFAVLRDVMWKSPENLLWIDLSYNYLITIDEEISKFPNLQNLYLNYNYIKDLGQTQKLGKMKNLKSLNLFGNPVEQVPGYRMWVLGVMYEESDSLKKFDQVVITAKEFQSMCVWNERFNTSAAAKLTRVSYNYFSDKKDKKGNIIKGNVASFPPELKVASDDKSKN
jgi:Leucine-rich repeat (LRR) protein